MPHHADPADASRPRRILLVEDALDHAHLLITLLEKLGPVEVTHIQDGDQALQLVEEGTFDLVVTDLNLPGADGFDVIRRVKSKGGGPVLATTGYTGPQWENEAFRAGADGVIHKPLDLEDVREKVLRVLDLPAPTSGGAVLAVGARVGDAELGCGATLLKHAAGGRDVLILVLEPVDDATAALARRGAERLGCRLLLARRGTAIGQERIEGLLERIATEVRPKVAFIPTIHEDDLDRREGHRIAARALGRVPEVLAFATATSTAEFRPDRLEDVADVMLDKAEALVAFAGTGRKELTPRFAQASARYWGRLRGFGEVEPFEVIRSAASGSAAGKVDEVPE